MQRKKGHQCNPLATKKAHAEKNRSPMKPVGDQNSACREKQVTNEAHWRPKQRMHRNNGHQ
jgi:hypothetical protein